MKKHIFAISIIFTIVLMTVMGCSRDDEEFEEIAEETELIEEKLPAFDYKDVNMIPIHTSTAVCEVGYSEEYEILLIRFAENKSLYGYFDVDVTTYEDLMNAESMGKFVNSEISGNYEYEEFEAASDYYDVTSVPESQAKYVVNISSGTIHKKDCSSVSSMKEDNKWYTDKSLDEITQIIGDSKKCGKCFE